MKNSMNQEIEKMLQSVLNKTFSYGNRLITLTGYTIDEHRERVFIHTNEKENHYDRPFDGIRTFLKEFKTADMTPAKNPTAVQDILISNANNLGNELRDVLMDNIKKVKDDKEFIPQATAINNSINSMINLTKLQLDYLKTAQKFKEQGA